MMRLSCTPALYLTSAACDALAAAMRLRLLWDRAHPKHPNFRAWTLARRRIL